MNQQELANRARSRGIAKSILIDSSSYAYWLYPANHNDAKVIVFVHGYRGNHRGLEAIAGALEDYEIIIPDLPGFGLSSEIAEHSISGYSNWLAVFIEAVCAGREINLLGHSFGSIVVGNLATRANLRSVILINPVSAPALKGPRAALSLVAKSFYSMANALPEALGDKLLRLPISVRIMSEILAKTKNANLRAWIHKQHEENFSDFSSVRVAVEGYKASIGNNLGDYAKSIKPETLLIAGEWDDITSVEQQREVAKRYPNSTLRIVPKVGHLIHYEAPAEAADLIRTFLS